MTEQPELTKEERVGAMNDLAHNVGDLASMVGQQTLMIQNLMESHEELIVAVQKGAEMREAQRVYFDSRKRENLIASKIAEKEFDTITAAILAKIRAARDAMAEAAQAREAASRDDPAPH